MKTTSHWIAARRPHLLPLLFLGWAFLLYSPGMAHAQVAKQAHDTLSSLSFQSERLRPTEALVPLEEMQSAIASSTQSAWSAFRLSAPSEWSATIDKRHGLVSFAEGGNIAWIPGKGNTLALSDLAPVLKPGTKKVDLAALEAIARSFLPKVAGMMGVDPTSLVLNLGRSGQPAGHLWFVDFDVVKGGMNVEGARVVFRVNNGNLIQFGTENLPAPGAVVPSLKLTQAQALAAVAKYIGGFSSTDTFSDPGSLHLVPSNLPSTRSAEGFDLGAGRGLAKVYQLVFHRDGVMGTWQARVDATSGEVLELTDINDYATAKVNGELRPAPYADLSIGGNANAAGLYNFTSGTVTSTLNGPFVKIADACGAISQASDAFGNIAFGSSTGTDCATPGHGGAGNTHSSRGQFYQINRIKDVAKGWLPANPWLGQKLTVNTNLGIICNADWDKTAQTLNFGKTSSTKTVACGNTGEIAAVSLHEFGHGLDQNDGTGSSPDGATRESYGDTTALIALHDSCLGAGFYSGNSNNNCDGYGDACTSCTGVRDADYAKHASNLPAAVDNFTRIHCPVGDAAGPCGRDSHCESYVPTEAIWDFVNRDLPGAGTGSAWAVLDRLWYLSRSSASSAFSCAAGGAFSSNGCGAGSLWRVLRAADDDDGNLANGTPHGAALSAAFNRHGIDCTSDPGGSTSFRGCTAPAAPTLTVTPGNNSAALSWTTSGTAVYDVFRNEQGCNAGFTRISSGSSAVSLTDSNVASGTVYYYQVTALPSGNEACASAPSNCSAVTPFSPDFTISCTPSTLSIPQDDARTSVCRITSVSGFASATHLSCSGLPAGVTCSFTPGVLTPPAGGSATSTLSVLTLPSTAPGTFAFQVVGTGGSVSHSAALSLTVTPPPVTISSTTPVSIVGPVCKTVTWTAHVNGGVGPFSYAWTNDDGFGNGPNSPTFSRTYCGGNFTTTGTFHITLAVTDAHGLFGSAAYTTVINYFPAGGGGGCVSSLNGSVVQCP